MDKEIIDRMMEATRLTRSGRLQEATALLQRGLAAATATDRAATGANDVIDVECAEIAVEDATDNAKESAASTTPKPAMELPPFMRRWTSRKAMAAKSPQGIELPGKVVSGNYSNAAGERSYRLYVPASYAGQPLPLIVMLHGCKQTPDDFAAGTRMNELGEAQGCFVLYPAQSSAANAGGCWNWFRKEDQARDKGEPSILARMVRRVMADYSVDGRRVYAAGLSAGGAMAAVLVMTYPDLFAAVGIHSGLACGSAHDLPSALAAMKGMPVAAANAPAGGRAMPTIVFHGDRDRTVHPHNGADVISLSRHHQDDNPEATIEHGQAAGGHAYTRTVHRNVTGRIVLEHWNVHGGGHAWFGGSRAGSYTDARGPDASREIVRFFLQSA